MVQQLIKKIDLESPMTLWAGIFVALMTGGYGLKEVSERTSDRFTAQDGSKLESQIKALDWKLQTLERNGPVGVVARLERIEAKVEAIQGVMAINLANESQVRKQHDELEDLVHDIHDAIKDIERKGGHK